MRLISLFIKMVREKKFTINFQTTTVPGAVHSTLYKVYALPEGIETDHVLY